MRRSAAAAIAAAALLPALAPLVAAPAAQADDAALAREVEAVLGKHGLEHASVGLVVVDLATGQRLVAIEPDRSLLPASSAKLFTTATALAKLGADHQLRTVLARRGTIGADGVLRGDLVVIGGGDPSLSGRFYRDGQDSLLDAWAAIVAEALGVTEVTGDLVADDRLFEPARPDPTWEKGDLTKWYAAVPSALSFNDNCLDVVVGPGAAPGDPATVTLRPATGYAPVRNDATTTASEREHVISIDRRASGREIRVGGRVLTSARPYTGYVTVPEPGIFLATVLREALERHGVAVNGEVRLARRDGSEPKTPTVPIADYGHRLDATVGICNRRSQNLYAECILRLVGAKHGEAGSAAGGSAVVTRFLETEAGVAKGAVHLQDGSGLSRENRTSAAALVALLTHAHGQPWGESFRASLARPGKSGTLKKRLRELPDGALSAKTGTLRDTSALAGYVTAGDRELAFAFLGNGLKGGVGAARRAQDEVVRLLVGR